MLLNKSRLTAALLKNSRKIIESEKLLQDLFNDTVKRNKIIYIIENIDKKGKNKGKCC